jgi:hypothetical protein
MQSLNKSEVERRRIILDSNLLTQIKINATPDNSILLIKSSFCIVFNGLSSIKYLSVRLIFKLALKTVRPKYYFEINLQLFSSIMPSDSFLALTDST